MLFDGAAISLIIWEIATVKNRIAMTFYLFAGASYVQQKNDPRHRHQR